jgi:hypothetical protein
MQALQNVTLVKSTREAAHSLFMDDPGLKKHPLLKRRLKEFEAHIHLE